MAAQEPSLSLGIEEEYLLVDKETRDLVNNPPKAFLEACTRSLGEHVSPEFLRCQIEIGTPVCRTLGEARQELARMRRTIAEEAAKHNLAPIAASTHPFADWRLQINTDKERYNVLAREMQVVARRLLICGMHVHLGIEDEALRIDLLNQLPYFLPHLLALSTSSPFWGGENTGLKSYRLSVIGDLPRTGLPPSFTDFNDYRRTVDTLIEVGEVEDGTKIWWDLRPSARFPTLEMRITDLCTRLDDALAVAAFYRCLARMLFRLRRSNQRWRSYSGFLINENRWLAQRFGVAGELIDFGLGAKVPFRDLIEESITMLAEDAAALGCERELERTRTIAMERTSADRQLAVYDASIAAGAPKEKALRDVVDHLITETVAGCG